MIDLILTNAMGVPTRGVGIINQPRGNVEVENYSNSNIRTEDVEYVPEKIEQ